MLEELGIENTALGFISGFTGEALEKGLQEKGIKTDFIRLADGITRINVKIKTDVETEINATKTLESANLHATVDMEPLEGQTITGQSKSDDLLTPQSV